MYSMHKEYISGFWKYLHVSKNIFRIQTCGPPNRNILQKSEMCSLRVEYISGYVYVFLLPRIQMRLWRCLSCLRNTNATLEMYSSLEKYISSFEMSSLRKEDTLSSEMSSLEEEDKSLLHFTVCPEGWPAAEGPSSSRNRNWRLGPFFSEAHGRWESRQAPRVPKMSTTCVWYFLEP